VSVPLPRLNAIADADVSARAGRGVVDMAAAFLDGGARFLQVRGKRLPGRDLLDAAAAIVRLARPRGALVIVNDRADIAKLAGAAGVHLGQDDLSPAAARSILGPAAIIGRSTHTLAQVERAAREPVDYIAVGPVFATRTKEIPEYEPLGVETVTAAARAGRPIVAIGGITLDSAGSILAAGAASVAVIGDLLAGDPAARVREYIAGLERI
jgi:thiamine-phosphate pyrophosphorylase